MIVKTTLPVLLLLCLQAAAQNSSQPTFSPLPAADANGADGARRPFRRGGLVNTNANMIDPASGHALTNVPLPGATSAAPSSVTAPPAVPVPSTAPAGAPVVPSQTPGQQPAAGQQGVPGQQGPPGQGTAGQQGAASQQAGAPSSRGVAPGEEMVPAGMIKFQQTDLNQVLQIYGELVNRTVLRPATLPAPTISLTTQTPLTRREAMDALKAVLWLNGIAVEDFGEKFVKVVPAPNAGQVGAPISTNAVEGMAEMGQFITHIAQLKYTKPSALVTVLTPFASPGVAGGIVPIDDNQILVLRDSTENVKRMLEMVKTIDVSIPSEFISEVIPIKYALAADISSALNSLSSGGGGTTVGTSGAGGAPGGLRTGAGGRTTSPYGRGGTMGYPGSQGTATPFGATTPGMGGVQGAPGTGSTFADRLGRMINKINTSGEIQVLGQTKIIADERTNSLLIFASREDMKTIKDIVAKLDVVLAQVLIEAAIVQVSLSDSMDLGISYLQKSTSTSGNFRGIGAINNRNILNGNTFLQGSGTNGLLPSGFSYLASFGNDLDVTITALASGTKAKILQRPRIQTSHAVPATLFVGEQRPYPVSSYYGGGAFGGYASIQQLQIGVTIEVTPLINPDGLVVMDIHTKIDSFEGNVTIQNVGDVPVTSSKDATAKVAVRDRDTIMLGGLIETTKNANNSGVPFLKDLPLLGYLFRASHNDSSRQELIVLIRPTVLPTPEVAALASRAEKDRMPAVKELEKEIQSEESKRLRSSEKDLK
jgi:general secretion pathway protein D